MNPKAITCFSAISCLETIIGLSIEPAKETFLLSPCLYGPMFPEGVGRSCGSEVHVKEFDVPLVAAEGSSNIDLWGILGYQYTQASSVMLRSVQSSSGDVIKPSQRVLNFDESGLWIGQSAPRGELFTLRLCNRFSSMPTVPNSRACLDFCYRCLWLFMWTRLAFSPLVVLVCTHCRKSTMRKW